MILEIIGYVLDLVLIGFKVYDVLKDRNQKDNRQNFGKFGCLFDNCY